MIVYRIVHHVPGRVRVEVPGMKRVPLAQLAELSTIPLDTGILDIRPNPVTGTLVILYDPEKIDIQEQLKQLASSPKIQSILVDPKSN